MKKILLINLRRLGDIYSMARLIPALKEKDEAKIDLLVYKECSAAAVNLSEVSNVHTIDRKSIITKKNNPVFQDGMALNEFNKTISRLKQTKWDLVVNISNDLVSAYLVSILTNLNKAIQYAGIRFSASNTVVPSNDWAIVLNDVLPCFKYTPFHFQDCYRKILSLDEATAPPALKINSEFEKTIKSNFESIRKDEALMNSDIKLIGLQLKASTRVKEIPFEILAELINLMLDTPDLYPILLVSPTEEEKNYAHQLNSYFDNRLVVIESDLCALNSILQQLDLLITPDTVTKHIADINNKPLLEISLGTSPFLKQGAINSQSLILSNSLKSRSWNSRMVSHERNNITAKDIFNVAKTFFQPSSLKHLKLSPNVTLFKPVRKKSAFAYIPIVGEVSHKEELSRQFAKSYITTKIEADEFYYPQVSLSYYQTTKDWIQSEKNALADVSRKLLKTLRELIRIKDSANADKSGLVSALDDLLLYCNSQMLAALPLLFFRAKLESLPKSSFKVSSMQIESLLYLLKEDLQILATNIKTFDQSLIRNSRFSKTQFQQEAE